MKIADNRLLMGTVLCLALYWMVGLAMPWAAFSPIVNLFLVVASGLLFLRFAPDSAAILFQGVRNEQQPDGDGSHLAVYGTTLVALGGVISAIVAFMLVSPTLRAHVASTPLEVFGRGMAATGLVLIFISPSVNKRGVRFSGGIWFYLAAALTMAVVYGLGYSAGWQGEQVVIPHDGDHIPDDRPRCPLDRPVWVGTSGVAHDEASPYRRLVIPVRCFATIGEAQDAGFRPPG